MSEKADDLDWIGFRRNQFSTRLPAAYLYNPAHYWLCQDADGLWRVGFTGFATRMLGEIVEFEFEVEEGETVEVAQCLGWIEGFKATSDLVSVARGEFAGFNRTVADDPSHICKRPYTRGWLYGVRGEPDALSVDVHGYMAHLEATIDKMLEKPFKTPELPDGSRS